MTVVLMHYSPLFTLYPCDLGVAQESWTSGLLELPSEYKALSLLTLCNATNHSFMNKYLPILTSKFWW